jgi:hypothetical protein
MRDGRGGMDGIPDIFLNSWLVWRWTPDDASSGGETTLPGAFAAINTA